jgi:hypothetical protein
LSAAPCDDARLPDAPVPGPSGKVAALAACGHAVPNAVGHLLPSHAHCVLPPRRVSRLDEPPE